MFGGWSTRSARRLWTSSACSWARSRWHCGLRRGAGLEGRSVRAAPFATIEKTTILCGNDQREVAAAGTSVRLRLVNTEQQPRRFALSGQRSE